MISGIGAAISLATETPPSKMIRTERSKDKESIVNPIMLREIVSQVIYQSLVLGILLFAAPSIFSIQYELYNT